MHSFDLNTDGKIRSFAVSRQCTLEQIKRAIELVGVDSSAVNKYLMQRGLARAQPNPAMRKAAGWR